MKILFVHGMGRSPASGWMLLRQFKLVGFETATFGYLAAKTTFSEISHRLAATISSILEREELILIGHSLGGVLIRDALRHLPTNCRRPKHLFLLGSPVHSSNLARKLAGNILFRVLTRDCGQLLGSAQRMAAIGPTTIPTTSIVGTRGLTGNLSPFRNEENDGVVSVKEVSAEWIKDQAKVPVIHSFLPSSKLVARIILRRLEQSVA